MLHISIRQKQSKIKARETSRIQTRKTCCPSLLSHSPTDTAQLQAAAVAAQHLPEITLTRAATTTTLTIIIASAHRQQQQRLHAQQQKLEQGQLAGSCINPLMDIHI